MMYGADVVIVWYIGCANQADADGSDEESTEK